MSKQEFDEILLEAVDEVLSSLGQSSKQAIYFHLENSFHIKKQEIPDKIDAFASAIEEVFGLGANFLEISIMRQLHRKIGGSLEWPEYKDLTFVEYVAVAKRSFLQKEETEEIVEELIQYSEEEVREYG